MTVYSDKLREMINNSSEQSDNLANNISQIEDLKNETDEEIDAITNGVCGVAESDLTDYLTNVKLPEFQLIEPTALLTFGPTYGSINYSSGNITDWKISYIAVLPIPGEIILYEYEGDGWDNDTQIITWVDDFDFGNDYLTRPLTSGATYGLNSYKDNLDTAISILTNNKNKIDDSVTYFEDYAT